MTVLQSPTSSRPLRWHWQSPSNDSDSWVRVSARGGYGELFMSESSPVNEPERLTLTTPTINGPSRLAFNLVTAIKVARDFGTDLPQSNNLAASSSTLGYAVFGETDTSPDDSAREMFEVHFWDAFNFDKMAPCLMREVNSTTPPRHVVSVRSKGRDSCVSSALIEHRLPKVSEYLASGREALRDDSPYADSPYAARRGAPLYPDLTILIAMGYNLQDVHAPLVISEAHFNLRS
ncbi:uncharacterized protein B0H18DRAFT_1134768 [Fomitopsis serialis]|uniref:uncharacterized protein n=1 Tax=Fomitopsis serialis TaxID=139415 RepID=UPI002007EEBA|nr:uncharacterized protein B0H18DRAFT_1134768 [Neoantrodia serialis]KAH9938706.1 hypothetical protein B0H18DRAFT_1134768 [Neoantrodia serialis]